MDVPMVKPWTRFLLRQRGVRRCLPPPLPADSPAHSQARSSFVSFVVMVGSRLLYPPVPEFSPCALGDPCRHRRPGYDRAAAHKPRWSAQYADHDPRLPFSGHTPACKCHASPSHDKPVAPFLPEQSNLNAPLFFKMGSGLLAGPMFSGGHKLELVSTRRV